LRPRRLVISLRRDSDPLTKIAFFHYVSTICEKTELLKLVQWMDIAKVDMSFLTTPNLHTNLGLNLGGQNMTHASKLDFSISNYGAVL